MQFLNHLLRRYTYGTYEDGDFVSNKDLDQLRQLPVGVVILNDNGE